MQEAYKPGHKPDKTRTPRSQNLDCQCRCLVPWRMNIGGVLFDAWVSGFAATARAYVQAIERLVGIDASLISVGPGRDQVIRK